MGLHKLSDFGSIPFDVQPKHRGFLPRHLAIWAYATFDLFSLGTGLISMIWDLSKGCTIKTGRVLPSRELTYLALRKGTSSSKVTLNGKDVSSHEGFQEVGYPILQENHLACSIYQPYVQISSIQSITPFFTTYPSLGLITLQHKHLDTVGCENWWIQQHAKVLIGRCQRLNNVKDTVDWFKKFLHHLRCIKPM